jgi:hypothetical protein
MRGGPTFGIDVRIARSCPVLLAAALVVSGCTADVTTTYRDPRAFESRKTEDVLVIAERPSRPHLVIASLTAEGEARGLSRDELVAALRREAARLGGDALLVYAETNTNQFVAAGVLIGNAPTIRERRVLADVVVFTDAERPFAVPVP